jgi:DNA-binding transcriptional MerR regulator
MRIAELADRAGASVATVKYYLREGVLPAGTASSPNQHRYGEGHVTRVRVVQTLVHVVKVPVDLVKRLFHAKASTEMMGDVLHDMTVTGPPSTIAAGEVDFIAKQMGWDPDHPARAAAVAALTTLLDHGVPIHRFQISRYAQAAESVAATDNTLYAADNPDERMEQVLIGTLVGNQLFAAFRILAQEAQR